MANQDNPLGFKLFQGAPSKPIFMAMAIAASAKVYPGGLLKLSSGLVTPITDADDNIEGAGVSMGYADQALSEAFRNKAIVCVNPWDVFWRVQVDGAVAEADIGSYFKPLIASSDTTLKVARLEIDYTTKSATIGKAGSNLGRRWQLMGRVREPNNAYGAANCDCIFRFVRNLDAA